MLVTSDKMSRRSLTCRLQNLLRRHVVVLHLHNWLPAERSRVLKRIELRDRRAVENDVEPEVVAQSLCGAILISRERDLADARTPLHLDEASPQENVWFG